MDFGLAFSFPFQDEDWIKKVLIAAVISIIPILGQVVVFGWSLEIARRVIQKHPAPLADWGDFGGVLVLGLKGFVITFVYMIPIMLLSAPTSIASALLDPDEMATVITILSICTGCLSLIYGILMAFVLPAAYGQLASTDSIGSAFRLGRIVELVRAAPAAYLMVILGLIIVGILAPLGVILCFVGVFATMAYAAAVQGHLYGQAFVEASAKAPASA